MPAAKHISNDEVSFAIRYLDPDLNRPIGFAWRPFHNKTTKRWTCAVIAILTIIISLYFGVLRWLPTLSRLMN